MFKLNNRLVDVYVGALIKRLQKSDAAFNSEREKEFTRRLGYSTMWTYLQGGVEVDTITPQHLDMCCRGILKLGVELNILSATPSDNIAHAIKCELVYNNTSKPCRGPDDVNPLLLSLLHQRDVQNVTIPSLIGFLSCYNVDIQGLMSDTLLLVNQSN